MFKKILLGIGVAGLSIASAKSYGFTTEEQYNVGTAQLKPGSYRLVVNGNNVALEDSRGKVQANGSIENEARKFSSTAVVSTSVDGMARIKTIEIGGTNLQVDFNK